MEDEIVCDNCGNSSSQFFEQNRKFYLSPCQHCFCDSCVERVIRANPHFKCPSCNKPVQFQQLIEETKEEYEMKKIRDARQEVYHLYNTPAINYKDPKTKLLNLQKEELFILRFRGKSDLFNEKRKEFEEFSNSNIQQGKSEARRTEYENRLKKLIDEEKKFKIRKQNEYMEKRKNKKGILIDTIMAKKKSDEFYDVNNCSRIRPTDNFPMPLIVENPDCTSTIKPYLVTYVMRCGLEELLVAFS